MGEGVTERPIPASQPPYGLETLQVEAAADTGAPRSDESIARPGRRRGGEMCFVTLPVSRLRLLDLGNERKHM